MFEILNYNFYKTYFSIRRHLFLLCLREYISIPDGLAVRIPGFHPGGPGSTPGQGIFLHLFPSYLTIKSNKFHVSDNCDNFTNNSWYY